jgi:hypothetical protein
MHLARFCQREVSNDKLMKTIEQVSERSKEMIVKLANLSKIAHFMKRFSNSEDSKEYFGIHENTLSASKAILFKASGLQSRDHDILFGSRWEPIKVYAQIHLFKLSDLEMITLLERKLEETSLQVDEFTSELGDNVLVQSLNQVSNNLMILLSALNTQRIYAFGLVSEIN